jgi:uncharacterized protein YbaP (TraB family)
MGRARSIAALLAVALVASAHAESERSLLWRVAARQNVVYLVGSVHMLRADYYPLARALDTAFDDSNLLVEEVDFAELLAADSQLRLLRRGMLPPNSSLETVLSPGTYAMVTRRIAALGMPLEPWLRFKPWFLGLTMMSLAWQGAGFDPELGLDRHFYDRARAAGKPVQGLETVDFQVSRFDLMTAEEQDRLLVDSLQDIETEQAQVRQLADAWRSGDAAAVERIVLPDLKKHRQLYQRLIVERNRNWLPKIESLFAREGRTFVVVGAAHLVGPDGLIALLASKRYDVRQQ